MNIQNIIDEKLLSIKKNEVALSGVINAVDLLKSTGAFEWLRLLVQARVVGDLSNAQVQACNFAYQAGANDILEKLLYFKELFLMEQDTPKQPVLSFGSIEKAELSGDLTKEEAHALRTGQSIDYSKYYIKPGVASSAKANSGPNAK